MPTIRDVIARAKRAAFYKDSEGNMYRMDHVLADEDEFLVHDEESGEEYLILLSDLTGTEKFYELTEIL